MRRAGLPVGPGQVLDALRAVLKVGLSNRDDFYWALHAVFVKRLAQREIFNQAFFIFWRNPEILERMMQLVLPDISDPTNAPKESEDVLRRVTEALSSNSSNGEERVEEEVEFDASLTWSSNELFGEKDFEKMSTEEIQLAISAVRRIKLPQNLVQIRRFKVSNIGKRIDMRRTMRAVLRSSADFIPLMKRSYTL